MISSQAGAASAHFCEPASLQALLGSGSAAAGLNGYLVVQSDKPRRKQVVRARSIIFDGLSGSLLLLF